MWVFTQDGMRVVDIRHFFVTNSSKVIDCDEISYSVFGIESNVDNSCIELGRYYSEHQALEVLELIFEYLKYNKNYYNIPN